VYKLIKKKHIKLSANQKRNIILIISNLTTNVILNPDSIIKLHR